MTFIATLLLGLQAAPAQPAPDIELRIDASVRRVRIERQGEASLEVRGGEGSVVNVEAPEAAGRRTLRNVNVRVRAEARIAAPEQNPQPPETPRPE
jgi:hypothetical protein